MKRGPIAGYLTLAGLLAAVWVIQIFAVPWSDPYVIGVLTLIGIRLVEVVGLSLVLGFTGQFSLGHAGFMAVGAYVAGYLNLHMGVPPLPATIIGAFAAAVAGLIVGLPSLRLTGDYLAVVTLGFNGIIVVILRNTAAVGGALGMTNLPQWTNFGWTFSWLLIGGYFIRNLLVSSHGRLFMAVRDNEIALRSLGVDTTRVKVTAFVIAAFWAGIAGGLFAFLNASISPNSFGYEQSIEILAMVVLGGTGSLSGPLIAGAILTALPEFLRGMEQYRMVIYSGLLIVMMILRPQGLMGNREVSTVLARGWAWIVARRQRVAT